MTQDEIIEMAKEAGWKDMKEYDSEMNESFFIGKFTDLESFAKLVAKREREACAKLADEYANGFERNYSEIIADEIRARGQS